MGASVPQRARRKRQYATRDAKIVLVPEDYVSIVVFNPLDNSCKANTYAAKDLRSKIGESCPTDQMDSVQHGETFGFADMQHRFSMVDARHLCFEYDETYAVQGARLSLVDPARLSRSLDKL